MFSAVLYGMVTSSVTRDPPSMTLSETQIDKFCQSSCVFITPQTASQMPQLPFGERWLLLFLRQSSLQFPMSWEQVVQVRFVLRRPSPGCGNGLGAGHRNRPFHRPLKPAVFAAIL